MEFCSQIQITFAHLKGSIHLSNSKKKLCIVVSVSDTINAFMLKHISFLKKYYDITVVVSDSLMETTKFKVKNIKINRKINLLEDICSLYQLYTFFRKNKFDVVVSVTPKAGLLSMLSSFFAGSKTRLHFFTGQVWAIKTGAFRSFLKMMDKLIVSFSTNILIDSQSQKKFLIDEKIIQRSGRHKIILRSPEETDYYS